jgi:hypothetical protein
MTPLDTLRRHFSHSGFRGPQEAVIEHLLAGRFGTESTHCRDGTDGMAPRVPGLSRISPLRRIHGCCRRGDIEPAPEKPGDPPALAERIRQHPLVGHVQHLPRRA